jgi:hypothetical protein
MPSSQNSETSNNNLERDSNNEDSTKIFIENYIKDINSYLGDFSKTSQPIYNPNDTSIKDSLPNSSAKTTSSVKNQQEIKQETTPQSSFSLSELLKSPTINPEIFSNRPFKDDNTNESSINDDNPKEKQETKQSLAQKLKISEIHTNYFDQKKEIWNGALLNCSELHIKLQECMTFGGFFDKISLCTSARRKFWGCMENQKVSNIYFNKSFLRFEFFLIFNF